MSYYNRPSPVDDEATPILIPTAVGMMSVAVWIAVFVLVFPWDSIPAPEVCKQIPITKGFWNTVTGYRTECHPSMFARGWVGVGAGLWTIGATFLAVVLTLRSLTRGRVGNV